MRTAAEVKANGVHYTPEPLAMFLARRALAALPAGERIRVLDPACGDGGLLEAVARTFDRPDRIELVGLDTDEVAIAQTRRRLERFDGVVGAVELQQADFLEAVMGDRQPDLFAGSQVGSLGSFDLAISNPPYVRTQVLGAAKSQALAERFGLSGRVDLYHAFAIGLTEILRPGGSLGLLCSNRFLSTRTGEGLRRFLVNEYELIELYDLGDTKLFAAAVLPAVLVARRNPQDVPAPSICRFARAYEVRHGAGQRTQAGNVLTELEAGTSGDIETADGVFRIEQGRLDAAHSGKPWRISSGETVEFLDRIASRSTRSFSDVVKIRVGIKTTADSVFIRDDWDDLPSELQPESTLLKPILMRDDVTRWRADGTATPSRVLYPYDMDSVRRKVLGLQQYPGASAYLESHRSRLAGRKYVIDAGREWYEIWVPQRPAEWARPKIVFPDIAEFPRFSLDRSGAVVNGTCYWALAPEDDELLGVLLGVANSSLGQRFYDLACGNKLYAGRRRYMTQYVEGFPVPDPSSETAALAKLVEELMHVPDLTADDVLALETEVDLQVLRVFGLVEDALG
jgi:adenine-specific DNA-methyltransferase